MEELTPMKEAKAKKELPAPKKEEMVHAKAKKEPTPKKIALAVKAKKETMKKALDHKKGAQEGSIRGRCSSSGGGAHRQSLSLKFAMMSNPSM
jgi:hypothetical protein